MMTLNHMPPAARKEPSVREPYPVCASPYTAYVRDVPTRRTKRQIALFSCLECQSFWNPSGYVEDVAQLEKDLAWGLSVESRNKAAAVTLFNTLLSLGVEFQSIAEIGCGIDTLLSVAKQLGYETIGFDVNALAIEHATVAHGLEAYSVLWSAETPTRKIDLYLSISVLEHIERPRELIRNLCEAALRHHATLFISVPFLEKAHWKFMLAPDPFTPGTPFFDNDVHVTHFSIKGLMQAMADFGCHNTTYIQAGLWNGVLFTPPQADHSGTTSA
ncbi:class I SAM-dependent methyltransferase [Methylobacillus caricis]|uniref:class I SAM-dependent methyltransferase n=1 Tax=Methylobacillus caricis TaxID=1971611 RepID=UPI001CFFB97F|nr:class I SAM-dependent methyltransferase [Methylobacillus caricis]MCB5188969.1 class I SAM-dependent methyltransferase [Methylobacillus caricis]